MSPALYIYIFPFHERCDYTTDNRRYKEIKNIQGVPDGSFVWL